MLIIRSWNKLAIKFSPAAADWCRNLRAIDEIATYSTNFNFKRQNSRFFQKMSELTIDSKVKLNNGVEMPIFGFGTYLVTGKKGTEAMIHALKTGYLILDSAKFYENEEEVGEAVRSSGLPREKIFVVTKLFSTSGGRRTAIEAVEESLKQMDIGYIDQYLLHAPQGGRVLECYDVFLEYQKKGLIKTVGVSNFGVEHLEAMKNSGRPLPQVNQIELHPWCTQEAIVDWCKKNGVVVVGYSPFAKNNRLKDPVVLEVAKKYGRTPAQILIRYSLQKGFVTIPKSSDHKRIEDNAKVFDFSLSQEDMDRFDAIGRKTVSRCSWNPTTNSIPTEFGPTK